MGLAGLPAGGEDDEFGSLHWILNENSVQVNVEHPALPPSADAPSPPTQEDFDRVVRETMVERLTERVHLPRRIDVIHKGGQVTDEEACCVALRALWAVPLVSLVNTLRSVARPLRACCASGIIVAPSESVQARSTVQACQPSAAHGNRSNADAEALEQEERPRRPGLDGYWLQANTALHLVDGEKIYWADGQITEHKVVSNAMLSMTLHETVFQARLGPEGQHLVWSDGDTWVRITAEEAAAMMNYVAGRREELRADPQLGSSSSAPFDANPELIR